MSKADGPASDSLPTTHVRFTDEEIETARRIDLYRFFAPNAGHYVWDESGLVSKPSPFQERVFFVLNYDFFMRLAGGVEAFRRSMTWLPTWEQCEQIENHFSMDLFSPDRHATDGFGRIDRYRRIGGRIGVDRQT